MNRFKSLILLALLPLLFITTTVKAGHPCSHILICCRTTNEGIKFFVNGKWEPDHDYRDIEVVRDILHKIKDAGVNTVIIDMTNSSQWNQYWDIFEPMLDNIEQVCIEKEMQYFMFIGASLTDKSTEEAFAFWNDMAGKIWKRWAQNPTYRQYGYGDDRPILLVFQPADWYWDDYNQMSKGNKNYLSKFHIGTTQVNDPILPGKSDGWGYRNYSQSVDGRIRFASPNGGVHPDDPWYRVSAEVWAQRVAWAKEADHYSIYGSYDDTCDGIHWGIADTKDTERERNKYPNDDPYLYYNVLKQALVNETRTSSRID